MKISEIKIHGIKSYVDSTIKLSDYTVFVGENNSGKSNVLFALLWFFGKEKITSKDVNSSIKDDPYIEVEFTLSEGEDFTHPPEYLVDNKFRVRATIDKNKIIDKASSCEYYGYTGNNEDTIKNTKFMGWKTVARPSLGDVIYIPSIKPLSEELKFTANSALNQLVTKNIVARVKIEDGKNQHYTNVVQAINNLSSFIETGEDSAIKKLTNDISNQMLDYGKVKIGFDLVPPNAEELIKSCFRPHTTIDGVDEKLPLSSQGDGFQRSMMFSLISNLAELNKDEKTEVKNKCTFYLIEEPELFLHPNHQTYFRDKLEEISKLLDSQIILTSHSPYFLNHEKNYIQIKRVYSEKNVSNIAEVNETEINSICKENAKLVAEAKNECREPKMTNAEIIKEQEKVFKDDQLRYLLWIDPVRANAFLSQKVILVEGPTEKALFSFMFNNEKGPFYDDKNTSKVSVIDTVGKYHFYKFAKLLNKFGIKVWCVHDTDNDACSNGISHKKLNENISKLKEDGVVEDILLFNPNIENFLTLTKTHTPDIDLYINLENNQNECTSSDNYKIIVAFIRKILIA